MSHVFVSYSRRDKPSVDLLVAALREGTREVWIDNDADNLHPASRFMDVIVPEIDACQAFLFILSRNSSASIHCRRELAHARATATKIIPIWLEEPPLAGMPPEIDGVTGISWNGDPQKLEVTLIRLLKAIDIDPEWQRSRKRLLTAAKRWAELPENTGLLLRGSALEEGFDVIKTAPSQGIHLLPVELEYVTRSQAAEAAELAHERELRQRAVARQLAADAELVLQSQPSALDLAVLLGLESQHRSNSLQATHILRAGLNLLPRPLVPLGEARHSGPIRDLCFSSDGQLLATGGEDGTAKVWDTATGREVYSIDHGGTVVRVALYGSDGLVTLGSDKTLRLSVLPARKEVRRFDVEPKTATITRNGRYAAWGYRDGSARFCDLWGDKQPVVLKHDHRVAHVAITSDGKRCAVYSEGIWFPSKPTPHTLRLWRLADQSYRDLDHKYFCELEFSPTGRFLFADGVGGARVWDVESGRELYSLEGHSPASFSADEKAIACVSNRRASPSGGTIASGRVLVIARAADGLAIRSINEEDRIVTIAFCHGHDYIAAGTDSMVRVWETDTGLEVSRIPERGAVRHVAYSPPVRCLITATQDGSLGFWRLPIDPVRPMDRVDGSILEIAASANGRFLAVASGCDLTVFDSDTGEPVVRKPHRGSPRVDVADDGHFVLSIEPMTALTPSGPEDTCEAGFIIGAPREAEVWIPTGQRSPVHALSSNSEFVALSKNGEIILWSIREGAERARWTTSGSVRKLAFDPEGQHLAILRGVDLLLARTAAKSDAPAPLNNGREVVDVSFGTDGMCLVLHAGRWVSVWDAATGTQITAFEAGLPFTQLLPGPNSQHLLLVSRDTCVVWNLPANRRNPFCLKHDGFLSIYGGGSKIAVLQEEGRQISVWDILEGTEQARIHCYRTRFVKAVFIKDNRLAVVDDGGLRIEPIRSEDVQTEVCCRLNRQLTREEWERFLTDEPYQSTGTTFKGS